MKVLLSTLIILMILSVLVSRQPARPMTFLSSIMNVHVLICLALVVLLFYVNISTENNVHKPIESFRFEVSPGKSSYVNCCGKGRHGLHTQFQYTPDIDMDRRPCPIPDTPTVPIQTIDEEMDYKDVQPEFVMEGYSDCGCGSV